MREFEVLGGAEVKRGYAVIAYCGNCRCERIFIKALPSTDEAKDFINKSFIFFDEDGDKVEASFYDDLHWDSVVVTNFSDTTKHKFTNTIDMWGDDILDGISELKIEPIRFVEFENFNGEICRNFIGCGFNNDGDDFIVSNDD